MFKAEKGYQYSKLPTLLNTEEYRITINDKLTFMVFTKDGEKLINPLEMSSGNSVSSESNFTYLVEKDGNVKLPVIGRIKLIDMTLKEAEKYLESKYSVYYNDPFVKLNVINRRVIVFSGNSNGDAKVIDLVNDNTMLIEAIALAGGISDGKSKDILLIRGDLKNPSIYKLDLSTLKGVQQAGMVLQANDIIYVQPSVKISRKIQESILPYVTIFSSISMIIFTILRFK